MSECKLWEAIADHLWPQFATGLPKTQRAHGRCTTCTCTLHPQLQQSTWTFLPMDRVILLLVLPTCAIAHCTCLSHGLSTDCMWGQTSCFWSWHWRNSSTSFIFGVGVLCHLVLSLTGVWIACEVDIVACGVDAISLSQSYTHTSEKVQECSKWKISSQLWFLASFSILRKCNFHVFVSSDELFSLPSSLLPLYAQCGCGAPLWAISPYLGNVKSHTAPY